MSNFDDIFDTPAAHPDEQDFENQPFDKDAWKEKKQAERDQVYALVDSTAEAIAQDGGKFQEYLDVQSHFDRYSVGNALLIAAQMPKAVQLRDFDSWKESGASIKKQQKAISILEPGEEYTRDDGSTGVSYNVKKVFDISQTTAKSQAKPTVSRDDRLLLKALINHPPVPIQTAADLPDNVGAYYDHEQQVIFVKKGMDASNIFRSVSMELAHAELAQGSEDYSRPEAGFKAYCASYMLCKKNGVDVGGYDFKTLPDSFKSMEAQEIRAELSSAKESVDNISMRMSKVLEQSKSRGHIDHER